MFLNLERPCFKTLRGVYLERQLLGLVSEALAETIARVDEQYRVVKLFDVNVLIYAHRQDLPQHEIARVFWESQLNQPQVFGLSELVLSVFIRIVTNPKVFKVPTALNDAVDAIDRVRGRKNAVMVRPGPRHYDLFVEQCRRSNAKDTLVADAYHAALAIEHGCEWVSYDRDFARFDDLRWARLDLSRL